MAKQVWKPKATDKMYSTRSIQYDPYGVVPVDILIPFHGQYRKVYSLCESLWSSLGMYHDYKICLIDDASPNEHFITGFEKAPRTLTIRSDERLGFGGALNLGFQQTENPFVVIMHSDCIADRHGWLKELFRALVQFRDQRVGMVAPLTDNPGDGGAPCLIGKKNETKDDFILREGHLPLYCALSPREVFGFIKGFIKPYPYGWYEDEEIAYRMRAHGFQQGVSGTSWVHHSGGATINELCKKDKKAQAIMESNRDLCIRDIKVTKQNAQDVASQLKRQT